MPEDINRVLDFWFGDDNQINRIVAQQSKLWWGKNRELDNKIITDFGVLYESAISAELNEWQNSARGQLALIILLDQFSRVIHRDTALAFSQDKNALAIALDGIGKDIDKSLSLIERVFYYMPLEHSEDIDIQENSVRLFKQLLFEAPDQFSSEFENYLNFAIQHKNIIERFHRFPHRNKILERFSSADELAFLAEPGSAF